MEVRIDEWIDRSMTIFVQPKIIELYRVEKSSVYTLLTAISKVREGRGRGSKETAISKVGEGRGGE